MGLARASNTMEISAMTKKLIAAAVPLLLISAGFQADLQAQRGRGPSQEELVQRRDDKLAEDWVKQGNWVTDWDNARAEAKKSGEMIFAYFTRSYSP